jgi:hypothetical protein
MTLHRTPIHHEALGLIVSGLIKWQAGRTASGGWWTYVNGQLASQELLVALWEFVARTAHREVRGSRGVDGGRPAASVRVGPHESGCPVMRHVAVAAGLGAIGGATVGVIAFLGVTLGTDLYFRVAGWRETRREARSA